MSSYRQILYHIVFRTKDSAEVLPAEQCDELYKYIWGIIKNKSCTLYRINGMEEHIHILTDLHPSVCLADFVRDIKTASSQWLKRHPAFPRFKGWADGYAALTYAWRDKDTVIEYIKNQKNHHKTFSFIDEYYKLLKEHGLEVDEKDFP